MGPLFFLIYIDDLSQPQELNSEFKLFADNTSLFSIADYVTTSALTLNSDLIKIQDWPFNPDRTMQAQKIIVSRKKNSTTHTFFFDNSEIKLISNQKYLELTLDSKFSLNEHVNDKSHLANEDVGLLQELQTILPRTSL